MLGLQHWLNLFEIQNIWNILDFRQLWTPPEILLLLLLLLLVWRINSRMTSYLKIFVLIDFHFRDAIFPFNRAAPYGMTSAVPREQGRTSARSAERPLALDPRPHSSAAARASLEVSGALRDGAKDLTRRNFLSTPFQTLSDQKFRGATGRTNLKIFPAGVSTAA